MAQKLEDGSKIYTIDVPQKEGVPGYIGTFLKSWQNVQAIITSAEFTNEPIRVYYMVEAVISQIPEEKTRKNIRDQLDITYREILKQYKKDIDTDILNENQRNHCLILASLRTLGLTTDYVDKHIGISYTNKVGFVRKKDGTLTAYEGK